MPKQLSGMTTKSPHNGSRKKLEVREVRIHRRDKEKNREAKEKSSRKAR